MAKERVQVQGLGDVVPGIQPTIQRAGQYAVAQVRAAPVPVPKSNKLLDLAGALGTSLDIVQQYGKLKEFEFKKGMERGEMEAATADLEASIEGLDATGEKLVEQGLLPRSQLLGYQRAYRRRIGQRYARKTYASNLEARMEEVTQNLDSDADIIENILAEERQKITEQLGGSQFAMQGFGDYADSIENSFYNNAVKQRDRATQQHNESLVIEDANDIFPAQILEASIEDDYKDFENNLKTWMEERSKEDRIPRSRMVELVWNGMAKTAVSDLLFQKQPDKAEKILNAITNVDLTGEGGKLGNINRPNAEIRKETLNFKYQIQQVKDAIKKDVEFDANDIMAVFNAALHPIVDGPTGIESVDAANISAVQAFLKDVGFEGDIEKEANDLMKSGSPQRLLSYTRLYFNNDAKREAYGLALPKMDLAIVQRQDRARASLSRDELEDVEGAVKEGVARGIKAKDILDSYYPSGPITDPAAKAIASRVELEEKENTWFERDESYKQYLNSFERGLEEQVKEIYKGKNQDFYKGIVDEYGPTFKDEFNRLIKEEQINLKAEPNRLDLIKTKFENIKTDVLNNWKDNIEFKENYETGLLEKTRKLKPGESLLETFDQITEETAEGTIEKVITPILEELERGFFDTLPPTEEEVKAERELDIIRKIDLEELGLNKLSDRKKVWSKAKIVRDFANRTDDVTLEAPLILMRRKWGYPNPSEYITEKSLVYDLDFRETPFYSDISTLNNELDALEIEIKKWTDMPKAERNLDDYPVFSKWNEAFGVFSVEDIKAVADAQFQVLKKQSNN